MLAQRSAGPAVLQAAFAGIQARRARRRRVRALAAMSAAMMAIILAVAIRGLWPARSTELRPGLTLAGGGPVPSAWHASESRVVGFDDGSRLELAAGTGVRVTDLAPQKFALSIQEGLATFDVRPGGPRTWVVDAGTVRVRVLGTRFSVRHDASSVRVAVERGKVLVENARLSGGAQILSAGESLDVAQRDAEPHAQGEPSNAAPAPPPPRTVAAMTATPPRPRAASTTAVAPDAPRAVDVAQSSDRAPREEDALARADAARRANRPREAAAILASVADGGGPQSALASFTLGKVLADDLGDPSAAAAVFRRAVALGLPAALDEEAHARIVDCCARAGRRGEAATAARAYEAKYPHGRHLDRVRERGRE
jgi:transmembrane sensor